MNAAELGALARGEIAPTPGTEPFETAVAMQGLRTYAAQMEASPLGDRRAVGRDLTRVLDALDGALAALTPGAMPLPDE